MTVRPEPDDPKASPARNEILQQLERVLTSRVFADSLRLQSFLRYVVEQTLDGNADRIKGFTIAQEVFERHDPEDAQASTIVRVEAGRLRRRMNEYYTDEGSGDPLLISIPKGRYVPHFEPVPPASAQEPADNPEHGPQRMLTLRLGAALMGGAVVIALTWVILTSSTDQTDLPTAVDDTPVAAATPSIAVLPFQDATSDGSGQYLASGLTESLTTDLYKFENVDVISLSSVLTLDTQELDLESVARKLKVTHLLRGSIRGEPPSLRVTAQLYETATGKALWAERFDQQLDDALRLLDELSMKVMVGLGPHLQGTSPTRSVPRPAVSAEALTLFNQAMGIANPPSDSGRLQVALQAFRSIMEVDPDFAGGYAGAAYVHTFFAFWGHSQSPEEDLQTAFVLAKKAIARDPDFGLSYSALALALLLRREYDLAVTTSQKAIAVEPNNPYLNAYHGALLGYTGSPERGLPYARRALRLDPIYPRTPFLNIIGIVSFNAGRYAQAVEAFDTSLRRGGPNGPSTQAYRAASLWMLGRKREAREAMIVVNLHKAVFDVPAWLRRIHREDDDIERLLGPLREMSP